MEHRKFNRQCAVPYGMQTNTNHRNDICALPKQYPSLAIVYSPQQSFDGLFEPLEALCRGTLFSALDKPFYGTCDGNMTKGGICR